MPQKNGIAVGHQARCACGWSGSTWFTKGARDNAWAEYRTHKETCTRSLAADAASGKRKASPHQISAGYAK